MTFSSPSEGATVDAPLNLQPARPEWRPDHDAAIACAALEVLDQGVELLASIHDADYSRCLPTAFNASIGSHFRHCLDHFQSILRGAADSVVDYDQRRRDPVIETVRSAAMNEAQRIREGISNLPEGSLERMVRVICKTGYAASGSQAAMASLGRELMYAVAHAVHHYALIGIMANLQGIALPEGFGVAPSTIKHQRDQADGVAATE